MPAPDARPPDCHPVVVRRAGRCIEIQSATRKALPPWLTGSGQSQMPVTRPFKSIRRTGDQQAATPAFHQGHQGHQSRQGYQGEMDGASQTPLWTPSSNNSAFTHHPQLYRAYSGRFSPADDFTPSVPPRGIPHSATANQLPLPPPLGFTRANKSSATWTSSSGDLAGLSDSDEIQDRPEFVYEYNRLARKVGNFDVQSTTS